MQPTTNKKTNLYLSISVAVLVVFRFVLMGFIPLLDKTESRYAEIARLMYQTKEWIVLQIDYGIPFWAKPPLSTWLAALSFEVFGLSEIAARLPFFALNILLLVILGKLLKKTGVSFYLPAFILLSTPEFLIHTGVISTDTALAFCIALIMISFWKALKNEKYTFWNYLFFIALGFGLLSKGPLILVLTAPPIFIWLVFQKTPIKKIYRQLPWFTGTFITLLMAVPWYLWAEKRSPGFLDYFIVGEHFKRFLEPGWQGDLYGSGHAQPNGMIWVFLLLFAFPWIQIVLFKLWKTRKNFFKDAWVSYLTFWLLWTPLFFTLSKNILHTYTLPVMVPMALLIIHWWDSFTKKKTILSVAAIFPTLTIIAFLGIVGTGNFENYMNTDKYLLETHYLQNNTQKHPIYYWKGKSYSGQFYLKGKLAVLHSTKSLDSVLNKHAKVFLVVPNKLKKDFTNTQKAKMTLLGDNYKKAIYSVGVE